MILTQPRVDRLVQGKPTKQELYSLYWTEKRNQTEVAKICGVVKTTIANWLKEYKIPLKSMSEAKTGIKMPSKEKLFYWYWKNNESTEDIANRLGVGRNTIARQLNKLNIPRKGFFQATWKNPKYIRKQMKARNVSKNKQEIELECILEELFGSEEYIFVGDANFILGGYNPDFLNASGKNKLIDFFGEVFHKKEEEKMRGDYFNKFGFEHLVVWGRELRNKETLKEKLRWFNDISLDKNKRVLEGVKKE